MENRVLKKITDSESITICVQVMQKYGKWNKKGIMDSSKKEVCPRCPYCIVADSGQPICCRDLFQDTHFVDVSEFDFHK